MEQNINKPVGQVAGRDINNYSTDSIESRTAHELKTLISRENKIIRQSLQRIIFNIPNLILLTVTVCIVGYMWWLVEYELPISLSGSDEKAPIWVLPVIAFAIFTPAYFSLKIRKEEGEIISKSRGYKAECLLALKRKTRI